MYWPPRVGWVIKAMYAGYFFKYQQVCFSQKTFGITCCINQTPSNYNLGQNKMEQQTTTLPPPPNQGWSRTRTKTHHFPILDFGGRGCINFPFILSKIVDRNINKGSSIIYCEIDQVRGHYWFTEQSGFSYSRCFVMWTRISTAHGGGTITHRVWNSLTCFSGCLFLLIANMPHVRPSKALLLLIAAAEIMSIDEWKIGWMGVGVGKRPYQLLV